MLTKKKKRIGLPALIALAAVALALTAALAAIAPAYAQQDIPFQGERTVTVMTYNVYYGIDAELDAILTPGGDLLSEVTAVYNGYYERNFPERAQSIADQIEEVNPELIGLQEAVLVRTDTPPDGPITPATTVDLDFVQILLDELAGRGLHYEVVAESLGLDAELPSDQGFDVRHSEREVILARADLKTADLKLSNPQSGNFVTNCTIPETPIGEFIFLQGWATVDVEIRGKSFRLISTHLDPLCPPFIQEAQAAEILAGPAATSLPVLLIGDLNATPDSGAYAVITNAGYNDAWTAVSSDNGFTCCQDGDLANADSKLTMRIDHIMYAGAFTVQSADAVGDEVGDKTPGGLWPSDHAGVAATLQLPHP